MRAEDEDVGFERERAGGIEPGQVEVRLVVFVVRFRLFGFREDGLGEDVELLSLRTIGIVEPVALGLERSFGEPGMNTALRILQRFSVEILDAFRPLEVEHLRLAVDEVGDGEEGREDRLSDAGGFGGDLLQFTRILGSVENFSLISDGLYETALPETVHKTVNSGPFHLGFLCDACDGGLTEFECCQIDPGFVFREAELL